MEQVAGRRSTSDPGLMVYVNMDIKSRQTTADVQPSAGRFVPTFNQSSNGGRTGAFMTN
jgi:hypothetical protein